MKRTPLKRKTRLQSGGPLRKRRKTRKGQVPEAVLDDLTSRIVRLRDKVCQAGPAHECSDDLQCMHCITRDYRGVRWNEDNCAAGCGRHHTRHHDFPDEAWVFWVERIGLENYAALKAEALRHVREGIKIDRHAVKADLQARLKELQGREGDA